MRERKNVETKVKDSEMRERFRSRVYLIPDSFIHLLHFLTVHSLTKTMEVMSQYSSVFLAGEKKKLARCIQTSLWQHTRHNCYNNNNNGSATEDSDDILWDPMKDKVFRTRRLSPAFVSTALEGIAKTTGSAWEDSCWGRWQIVFIVWTSLQFVKNG